MATWREQLETVKGCKVKEGENRTMDCPFCGAKKKFTVAKKDGVLIWNCFRASCPSKGSFRGERGWSAIRAKISPQRPPTARRWTRPMPDMLAGVENHPEALSYLESVHSLEAFRAGLVEVSYAPADNRVLFCMNKGKGAVGRSLDGRTPKWQAYGDTSGCFMVGTGPVGVLVEDPASACAVGVLPEYTGVALLGTNLSTEQKFQLRHLERLIIALDKDASKTSMSLVRRVEGLIPSTVRLLSDDMKWLSQEQIRRVLK